MSVSNNPTGDFKLLVDARLDETQLMPSVSEDYVYNIPKDTYCFLWKHDVVTSKWSVLLEGALNGVVVLQSPQGYNQTITQADLQ